MNIIKFIQLFEFQHLPIKARQRAIKTIKNLIYNEPLSIQDTYIKAKGHYILVKQYADFNGLLFDINGNYIADKFEKEVFKIDLHYYINKDYVNIKESEG